MLRVAFASTDQQQVNTHFGAAERFVIYRVWPGEAELAAIGDFAAAVMKGENRDRRLPAGTVYTPGPEMAARPGELDKPPEDKVVAKLEFLGGCAAVYAASIGISSIKRLMSVGIQPIIVDNGHDIEDLLNEVSLALACRGLLSWVDKAAARAEAAGQGSLPPSARADGGAGQRFRLITSEDDLV
ncbi:NifB/NifX family molybdenum-iron cluster-binding protein [Pseudothauera rhizosphaerae]|uniref:Vanadium nitrogenase n=1 Tax=Pseudothauera rhizosphaerae TaxID=2565932 RepID=A0A4S4A8K8_9RHOO|nr:NifB/NifX family molybdenum-iron cluster-binding protein [Pseudothauera rhizosphaerae]THF55157.1 vanadium nitrogenase [Pseudothauera rhizosphaerae]